MRYPAIVIFSILLTCCYTGNAQCLEKNFAFTEGEKIGYEAYYNWGFIWLNAGYVEFEVKQGEFRGHPVYHFDAYGASHKNYDWIFKVRDNYESYLDKQNLLPLWFHRENYEGGFEVDNKYLFDHENNSVYSFTWNSDRPFKKDTIDIPNCTYDVLSLIYFCRNLDFSNLAIGDSIPLNSILDNEIFKLYIRYLGRETVKTKEGIEYRCIKFSALLIEGSIFKGGEDLVAWVTDDLNRVPVLIEAKIMIGSVKAFLVNVEGLNNPEESRIE